MSTSKSTEPYDLDAIRRRDPRALKLMVEQESARIFRCAVRIVRDEDEARSLVQETFLQALKKIETFRGDSKLSTWLCAIAINLARAAVRKAVRYDLLEEEDIERLQPVFHASGMHADPYEPWGPLRVLEQEELRRYVRDMIDRLPETYRTVVTLRDIEGYSSKEVAQMLNISEGAMRVRLHRARQALRKLLDDRISD